MLDEIKIPEEHEPKIWICPCCKFTFNKPDLYIAHLLNNRAIIDAALRKIGVVPP